ncbi:MAG: hypothetical protein N2258_01455 [Brevinematales bacterium]|nr:hypothetical protein [Brevinematales bacterium]
MDAAALAKMYVDAIKNDSIEGATLTKLPELVTCADWKKVEVVGRVNYVSQRTKIIYDGIIVKYAGGLYYVRKKVAETLGQFDRRFSKVSKEIKVL